MQAIFNTQQTLRPLHDTKGLIVFREDTERGLSPLHVSQGAVYMVLAVGCRVTILASGKDVIRFGGRETQTVEIAGDRIVTIVATPEGYVISGGVEAATEAAEEQATESPVASTARETLGLLSHLKDVDAYLAELKQEEPGIDEETWAQITELAESARTRIRADKGK